MTTTMPLLDVLVKPDASFNTVKVPYGPVVVESGPERNPTA
jgi:hypothetical protein